MTVRSLPCLSLWNLGRFSSSFHPRPIIVTQQTTRLSCLDWSLPLPVASHSELWPRSHGVHQQLDADQQQQTWDKSRKKMKTFRHHQTSFEFKKSSAIGRQLAQRRCRPMQIAHPFLRAFCTSKKSSTHRTMEQKRGARNQTGEGKAQGWWHWSYLSKVPWDWFPLDHD